MYHFVTHTTVCNWSRNKKESRVAEKTEWWNKRITRVLTSGLNLWAIFVSRFLKRTDNVRWNSHSTFKVKMYYRGMTQKKTLCVWPHADLYYWKNDRFEGMSAFWWESRISIRCNNAGVLGVICRLWCRLAQDKGGSQTGIRIVQVNICPLSSNI